MKTRTKTVKTSKIVEKKGVEEETKGLKNNKGNGQRVTIDIVVLSKIMITTVKNSKHQKNSENLKTLE